MTDSPKNYDTNLWGDARMSITDSIDLTVEKIQQMHIEQFHVVIAYSGGKDSTTVATLIPALIAQGRIPAPQRLTVMFADTGMESPPLIAAAHKTLAKLAGMGIATSVVRPALDERFFVYMFGRGINPPKNNQRWCTRLLKIKPMDIALQMIRQQFPDEDIVLMTGVRRGESVARDQRLDKIEADRVREEAIVSFSCTKENAECGQGRLLAEPPKAVRNVASPILHWRVCRVWDWLMWFAPDLGFDTSIVADVYGDEDGEYEENARTGCIGCNLVTHDHMLERLLKKERWTHLTPLQRLRPLYAELAQYKNRFQADGLERRKDGTLSKRGMAKGPLTFEARRWGLAQVKAIQDEINEKAVEQDMPVVSLISPEEERRILELIEARTMPQRWTGDEVTGDILLPRVVAEIKGNDGKRSILIQDHFMHGEAI